MMDPSLTELVRSQTQFIFFRQSFLSEYVINNYSFLLRLQIILNLQIDHNKILW